MGNVLGGRHLHKFLGRGSKFKKQGFVNFGVDGMTLFGWIFKNLLGVPEVH
jgi:hypothetical protein